MSNQRDPRFDANGRPPRVPPQGPALRPGMPPARPPMPPSGQPPRPPGPPGKGGQPPRQPAPPGRAAPQRHRPAPPAPLGPGSRGPYGGSEMSLLTHDDSGESPVAQGPPIGLIDRRPQPGSGGPGDGGPRRPQPPKTRWRKIRPWLFSGLAVLFIGPFIAFVIGWMIFKVPTPEELGLQQTATFTFADGPPIATLKPEGGGRVLVGIAEIPENLRNAAVAAEDSSFYSNPGFDLIGIARAVVNQLHGSAGGGSTITQQLVKVTSGDDSNSLWRKYKEVIMAAKITKEQSKEEILQNYLNTIFLGRGKGVQVNAQSYFHKDVKDLTLAESAMLAGIIQGPSADDPAVSLPAATGRWNYTLDEMVKDGFITKAERDKQVFPKWYPITADANAGIPGDDRYHIFDQALAELGAQGITKDMVQSGGMTITTTIDSRLQKAAVDARDATLKGQPQNLRSALVSVEVKTGKIVAYDGGLNGVGQDYAQVLKQPGSSFKPFVFDAALQTGKGIGLGSTYDGRPDQTILNQKITNSDGESCGESCTIKTAMTKSVNTVFYNLLTKDVGPVKVVAAAHAAGIPDNLLEGAEAGIALGDKEVHPGDMASAFATFAADGIYHKPFMVQKVVDTNGKVWIDHTADAGTRAMPQQVARNVTESMVDVPSSSRIPLANGRIVAGKTGTVQHQIANQNNDAWMVGYTPSISTAVWVGTDQNEPIKDKNGSPIYGRMVPGSIWQSYMDSAFSIRKTPNEPFSTFEPMGTQVVVATPDPTPDNADNGNNGGAFGDGFPFGNNGNNGDNANNGNDNGNNNGNNDRGNNRRPRSGN